MNPGKNGLITGILSFVVIIGLISCGGSEKMGITKRDFGKTPDGKTVDIYTLTNANGAKAEITNYGGIMTSLTVPDRHGNMDDVLLGYDNLDDYIRESPYFGALIGRYGNRIGGGRFTLDGKTYTLATNNGPNHLHGGIVGFDKVVWNAEPVETKNAVGLKLTYLSKDGEEGYPGNLNVTVTYWLTNHDELKIVYDAVTDKPTVCNLTQHNYYNLSGAGNGDILDHVLEIRADRMTPVDENLIPTGEITPVAGTPFDFREPAAIGARINDDNIQIRYAGGYDHNFVLNNQDGSMALAARVSDPASGRAMEVFTTEPGIQFYSGNFLDGSLTGKNGASYKHRYGLCLETQHYPDSPNKPDFPSVVLRPGEKYHTETTYRFYAD